MASIVKVTLAAIVEKLDPKEEVQKFLLNYRATPHPTTGQTPSQLLMGRKLRTKIPVWIEAPKEKEHLEARLRNKDMKQKQREYGDKRRRAKERNIKQGDKVLIQQKKTTTKAPFDPSPFTVTKVENTKITAKRGKTTRTRNVNKWKLVPQRPERFGKSSNKCCPDDTDTDLDWDFDLNKLPLIHLAGGDEVDPAPVADPVPVVEIEDVPQVENVAAVEPAVVVDAEQHLQSPTPPPFSPITPASPHTSPVSAAEMNEVTTRAGRVSRPPERYSPTTARPSSASGRFLPPTDIYQYEANKYGSLLMRRERGRSVRPEELARALEELRGQRQQNEDVREQDSEERNSSETDSLFHGLRTPDDL